MCFIQHSLPLVVASGWRIVMEIQLHPEHIVPACKDSYEQLQMSDREWAAWFCKDTEWHQEDTIFAFQICNAAAGPESDDVLNTAKRPFNINKVKDPRNGHIRRVPIPYIPKYIDLNRQKLPQQVNSYAQASHNWKM